MEAGLIIAIVFPFVIIVVAIICSFQGRRLPSNTTTAVGRTFSGSDAGVSGYPALALGIEDEQSTHFTFQDVVQITENFSKELGEGTQGVVYYGKLKSGSEVAVKKLLANSKLQSKEFLNKVGLLTKIRHNNLVSLIGFCTDVNAYVVYDYMSEGALSKRLHDRTNASQKPLNWKDRLNIAIDAAKGIEYLHNGCKPAIIHGDIKSNNIFLDQNLSPKVSEFGITELLSKDYIRTSVSKSMINGSTGYSDPEFAIYNKLTEKSDVYSFGIVLLEIISGRKPLFGVSKQPPYLLNIAEWARECGEASNIEAIVDPSLENNYDITSLQKAADIALMCVQRQSFNRPTINEVVRAFEEALGTESNLHEHHLLVQVAQSS